MGFNEIQKAVVVEKDTVVQVSKEIVDIQNQSTIDKMANLKDMEIVKKVASSAIINQSEVFGILIVVLLYNNKLKQYLY